MAEQSIYTRAVIEAVDDMGELLDRVKDEAGAEPVPFMREKVSNQDMRETFLAMTPEQRAEYVQENGVDKTFEMLRPKRQTARPTREKPFDRGAI